MARHPPTLPAEPQRSQPPGVAAFDTETTLEVSDRAPRATDEARKQLFERLEKTPVAMTVSTDADGGIRVRPLMTQKVEQPGVLWFLVPRDGGVAADVASHPELILIYAEPGDNAYVALSGQARVVVDPAKAKELWSPLAGAWFNEGPEDPRLGLLRVELDRGEAWESTEGKVLEYLRMAKAAITRTPPDHSHDHFAFTF